MPIVLIIVGLAVAVGLGSYYFRPETVVTPTADTVLPASTETTDSTPTEPETGDDVVTIAQVPREVSDSPTPTPSETTYADGTHTVHSSYVAPSNTTHKLLVSLTLTNDVVTSSSITFSGDDHATSKGFQSKFMAAYQAQVIGKKLDDIKLSRVGGASLTTGAFNDALAKVKATAVN